MVSARNGIAPSIQADTKAGIPALDVRTEVRRNLDAGADAAVFQTAVQVGVVGDRRLLDEVARTPQFLEVGAALRRLIAVENGKVQVVDVGRDAEAENDHQQGGAEQREHQPDGIAQQFETFADRVGEQALETEEAAGDRLLRRLGWLGSRRGRLVDRDRRGFGTRLLLEETDEGLLERFRVPRPDQAVRRVGGKHAPVMHEGKPVAARRLVHEMRRHEDRHSLVARQIDQQLPELVARHGIDPRCRLVQDQKIRLVHDRDRKRQPLANAERKRRCQAVEMFGQIALLDQFRDAACREGGGQVKQPGVQLEILPHRQLAVEREGLRHVADAAACLDIAGLQALAEDQRLALARLQQARQHLHGGGLAASRSSRRSRRFRRAGS